MSTNPLYRLLLILLACALPLTVVRAADPPAPPPFIEGKDSRPRWAS